MCIDTPLVESESSPHREEVSYAAPMKRSTVYFGPSHLPFTALLPGGAAHHRAVARQLPKQGQSWDV